MKCDTYVICANITTYLDGQILNRYLVIPLYAQSNFFRNTFNLETCNYYSFTNVYLNKYLLLEFTL